MDLPRKTVVSCSHDLQKAGNVAILEHFSQEGVDCTKNNPSKIVCLCVRVFFVKISSAMETQQTWR